MSQGIGSPKAEKAATKVSVLVSTDAPRPIRATAPRGKGCVMIPTMVARRCALPCLRRHNRATTSGGSDDKFSVIGMVKVRFRMCLEQGSGDLVRERELGCREKWEWVELKWN
ncbi:hypothetical protein FH972_019123 [Carpinus fangiana]|uniref:Uncharacterized protein n=1 Tax=Carpinus fangiana TaxID=176857 RepID=A0A5N6RPB9_9ROSI|nr:hypothetical protein FH972_019123 [Carpinus fangiana]